MQRLNFFSARCIKSILYLIAALAAAAAVASARADGNAPLKLKHGWAIQSSAKVRDAGDAISQPGYATQGWYPAAVPTTVVAALVADKIYPDPYFGMNLRKIPGTSYKIGANFSNEDMPNDSPFRVSWWYRTEFILPADAWQAKKAWLNFRGINYRANIWLNGHEIAAGENVAGAFRRYEFEVSEHLKPGQANALAVEVFPPTPHDLAITFVDWNPLPPDKDMGVWGDVFLAPSGPVAVRNSQVVTKLDPGANIAHLTVSAEVRNATASRVQGTLRGAIPDLASFSQPVTLASKEAKVITFSPREIPQLNISNPPLWWPYQMGAQNLQDLHIEFAVNAAVSDEQTLRFGMDEITSELGKTGGRLFKINGKNVLIRGGGYTPDMMLRDTPERWADDFSYVKGMNLNAVRLEGKLVADEFFSLADRFGILVMPGWCCCDHWERWKRWDSNEREVATASLRDQALRLRTHPSVFVWLNGSDNPPPADIETAYLSVLKDVDWPKPVISSATEKKTGPTGHTGVKMTGPYDYVPANYWLEDSHHGGAFGFNTETSPGPAVPPVESLEAMLGKDHLWPIDEYWDYHAGGGEFANIKLYTRALERRYGPAKDLNDYVWKSQAMAYEGERAMFEAFGQNKYRATGVIQWMLNNAWPSIIWHLYDYYLRPAGGYFGTKKACEPLHIQYSYFDRGVIVANQNEQAYPNLTVTSKIYDLRGVEKFSREQKIDSPADSSIQAFVIPDVPALPPTYFLKLNLTNSSGQLVSSNFYWLSSKPDQLDWDRSKWYYTPQSSFADLTGLSQLPAVALKYKSQFHTEGEKGVARVQIENPTDQVAFLVRLKVTRGKGGGEVLPVWWDDNYISLLPGEKREISAGFRSNDLQGATPAVEVDGWNVPRATN
ncbi:MAG: sugar-binding domain-containing protein [Candidatus Acidiferrales bacterium]